MKHTTLFFIGLWLLLIPLLGFPTAWKNILLFITAIYFFTLSYRAYRVHERLRIEKLQKAKTITESIPNLLNDVTNVVRE